MKLKNGKITFLIGDSGSSIELKDGDAGITFARIDLNTEQLSAILSRRAYVSCDISVFGLERVGKKMLHKSHVFDITGVDIPYNTRDTTLEVVLKQTLPEGWVSDNYYGSQDSFFKKDGKEYARVIIRKWVDITD